MKTQLDRHFCFQVRMLQCGSIVAWRLTDRLARLGTEPAGAAQQLFVKMVAVDTVKWKKIDRKRQDCFRRVYL